MPTALAYSQRAAALRSSPRRWLVTGAAGFIGSNLVERLVELGQDVVGLDNFATGHRRNLEDVATRTAGLAGAGTFRFIDGDICDPAACREAAAGADYVLHQAALGSVPRSIEDPVGTNRANIDGFVEMLVAARDAKVKRFVYAASSSTYGDHPGLPKVEDQIGRPLSPYAVTKYVNELYASVFQRTYGIESIGLRYFNVFGRRQDPNGAYAAVIPAWIAALMEHRPCYINGDGETTRDFCYVENVVQVNLLAATADPAATDQIYNVAVGERTTLNELFYLLRDGLAERGAADPKATPAYRDFRVGDVRHSLADVSKARRLLGYEPEWHAKAGLAESLDWYVADARGAGVGARG